MSAVQTSFSLRTSSNVETVHLVGSWDSYRGQLPLSREKGAKPGSWLGKFRFQPSMVTPGKRYWYYYTIDGYHVSHDPAAEYTVESTTGRKLNILDVPAGASRNPPAKRQSHQNSGEPDGLVVRGLSPSRIQHPKPSKPYASRKLREADYEDQLASRFTRATNLSDSDDSDDPTSPSSAGSLLSSRTDSTSPSSVSSLSDSSRGSNCSCKRYGITRSGDRVKLDCGGSRCGSIKKAAAAPVGGRGKYSREMDSDGSTEIDTSESDCSSDGDDNYRYLKSGARRQGIAVRR